MFAVSDNDAWATILVTAYLSSVDDKKNIDYREMVDKANIWLMSKLGDEFDKLKEYSLIASHVLQIP